jgi:hypothetical protein
VAFVSPVPPIETRKYSHFFSPDPLTSPHDERDGEVILQRVEVVDVGGVSSAPAFLAGG